LVLVDKPYYNEAGYEKQVGSEEGERNTAQYNEQAFLASAKTMIYLLRWGLADDAATSYAFHGPEH
jgi:ubiquitin-conjugating enzyme E2 O